MTFLKLRWIYSLKDLNSENIGKKKRETLPGILKTFSSFLMTSQLCLLAKTIFFSLKHVSISKVSNIAGLIWELIFGLKRD